MASGLSVDLRQRVVHAVEADASRHQAAERFGGSLAKRKPRVRAVRP